jgi:hypothetical protein
MKWSQQTALPSNCYVDSDGSLDCGAVNSADVKDLRDSRQWVANAGGAVPAL